MQGDNHNQWDEDPHGFLSLEIVSVGKHLPLKMWNRGRVGKGPGSKKVSHLFATAQEAGGGSGCGGFTHFYADAPTFNLSKTVFVC